MPKFTDCLTENARAEWYVLMKESGLAYGTEKMIEINTKLEELEEIKEIMAQAPNTDRRAE